MIFQEILPELAEELKIGDLSLNENNQLTLNFDDSLDVTFEIDEENDELLIFLPKPEWSWDKFASTDFLRGDMNFFCFGVRTNGFAFTYNADLKTTVLWRRYRNDFSGKEEILRIVGKLLDAAKEVEAVVLQGGTPASDGMEEGQGTQPSSSSRLLDFNIRV